jgi:hypothetical protein
LGTAATGTAAVLLLLLVLEHVDTTRSVCLQRLLIRVVGKRNGREEGN